MSTWFKRGAEGKRESDKKDAEAKLKAKNRGKGRRFWLKNDTSAKVTFLDNPDFFVSEHKLKIGNDFNNFFTCLVDFDVCPLCESGNNPSYEIVGTVIDHSVYIGNDGKEYRDQKKLLVCKGIARQHLLKQIARNDDNLQFCHFEISRGSGDKECSTGEDINFEKRLNKKSITAYLKKAWDKQGKQYTDEYIEEFLTPYNYEEVFKPYTQEELRKVVGGEVPIGSSADVSIDDLDDVVVEEKINTKQQEDPEEEITDIEDLL